MSTPATPTTVASEPQKLTWDAPDGKHYEGSPEDLFKIASERYNNLFPEYSKIKTEAQQAREQLELVQQATGAAPTAQPTGFDSSKYWQLMQQNPLEAQRYANQYDPDYQKAVVDLRATRQNQEAAIFKATNSDFEANEANVEKLARTCQDLFPGSEVFTAPQMTAAYAYMTKTSAVSQPAAPATPPMPPSSSVTAPTGVPDINQMSQDQLKAYILQLEQQGSK